MGQPRSELGCWAVCWDVEPCVGVLSRVLGCWAMCWGVEPCVEVLSRVLRCWAAEKHYKRTENYIWLHVWNISFLEKKIRHQVRNLSAFYETWILIIVFARDYHWPQTQTNPGSPISIKIHFFCVLLFPLILNSKSVSSFGFKSILWFLIMCMLHAHIFFIDLLAITTCGKLLNYRNFRLPPSTHSL